MFIKYASQIFLIVCVVFANLGSSINGSQVEDVASENDVSHQNVPCELHGDCPGWNNVCNLNIGGQTFCQCKNGSSGENCTVVDQCRDKIVDCGIDTNATCVLGSEGKAYCKCKDTYQGYDERTKTCVDCDCGDESGVDGCVLKEGKKKCKCELDYYENDEGKCVDCNCGDGSVGCKLVNGVKTCHCYSTYVLQGGVCVDCKCGPNAKCKMENSKIVCTCDEGYIPSGPNGHCLTKCSATHSCENGGTCSEGVCHCLNGTSGDLCRTIEECDGLLKCREALCLFDVYTLKAHCKCQDPRLTFEDYFKTCKVCDCGAHASSCTFQHSFKKCTCEESYYDLYGTCTLCSCKGPTDSPCRLDRRGKEICNCTHGYAQWKNECKRCDCGQNGVCEFETTFFDDESWKSCTCDRGYSYDGDTCRVCDCGDNGTCGIYSFGETRCSCYKGNEEFKGKCLECDCGENADCSFNSTGGKECSCHPGYGIKSEVCSPCDCGTGINCTFLEISNSSKQCICPEGSSDDRGTCRECDCRLEGSNCSFSEGLNKCRCPEGYSEAKNTSTQSNAICQDIDECLESGICPSSTLCNNTLGSYDCVCKDGYTPIGFGYRTKVDGCTGGGMGPWAIAGIVIGCLVGGMILLGAAKEFRQRRMGTRFSF